MVRTAYNGNSLDFDMLEGRQKGGGRGGLSGGRGEGGGERAERLAGDRSD